MRKAALTCILAGALCLLVHADEGGEKEVPPIPEPVFEDSALGEEYAKGLELLRSEDYKEAEKIFRRLRRAAPEGPPREGAERCYLEAKGGLTVDKIRVRLQKEQWRRALAECEKVLDDYDGTHAGEKLAEIHKVCMEEIYFIIEDFEEQKDRREGDPERDGGGDGREDEERGFGRNARVVEGSRKEGTVRDGDRALEWLTGRDFSYLSFRGLPEKIPEGYRYLNLSVRTRDPKATPGLRILFDCEDGELGWGGGGGRRGRRAARVLNRLGFHTAIATSGQWQDLRIDLGKLNPQGEVTWDDVRVLRIIHMPGGDGRIYLDGIRLEKK